MAGIITLSKGHDAAYPWKQIGAEDGSSAHSESSASRTGLGYYLSPAERGGEPPGVWTGLGVAELGLEPGGVVRRDVFERLYGQQADPRDPSGETRLGRAPGRYKSAEEIYRRLLAAEPHATAERRAELMVEAKAQVRTADLYWDATFSVSKSISLLHASALANAAAAAQHGDCEAAAAWDGVAEGVWESIMEGNAAALAYLQREAGQTRSGYHPGGRWEDAREWVIASFRQHTSRDGDPQLHVHNLILHKVRRERDGAWRALDSMSLYRHRPAASAIAALVMENALTARFGVAWVPRLDGHGREIAGVSQALMDMFSSRRASIGPLAARLAREYEAQFGRAPDARALASLRQWANLATRRGKDAEPLDLGALVRHWSAQAVQAECGALEPLAPAVLRAGAQARQRERATAAGQAQATQRTRAVAGEVHATQPARVAAAQAQAGAGGAHGTAPPPFAEGELLTWAECERLAVEAVAAVQQAQPTWTEADLIRHLGERLPEHVDAMAAADAAALLPALARRAVAGHAMVLSAPEWPRVPDCLRRASGESLYVPHGAARYTTGPQLDLEARLLADAAGTGAPRLDPAVAARLLGAGQAQLEAELGPAHDGAPGAEEAQPVGVTGCGLRWDQAAAAFWVLTSARRAEVLAGPAGSGKTTTVAELARMWRDAGMGEVVGLATSQTAANILTSAGITAFNTARFLGHSEERREARGVMPVAEGSLLVVDEASTMSVADLAAILAIARRTDSKVVITGDHAQLAAVEGGGGMLLLARRLGFVQLAEPQRFAAEWERDATLRMRAGDVTVLAEYEQHGRLRGGSAEDAVEQAYQGWLADHLDGTDSVLIARTEEHSRELSRRARDDLIRYGRVAAGPAAALTAGEQAGAGDLITARRNDRAVRAGEAGRELTNRDVLRVVSVAAGPGGNQVEVRRHLGRDPVSGAATWSAPFRVPRRYLRDHATLAYASTAHAALGRTTGTAHVLVDGLEARQGLYVAMSRGEHGNYAYCITQSPRLADTAEGTRRAPELDRAGRLDQERAGQPPGATAQAAAAVPVDPVGVLAGVMTRDGSELSATETLESELARADHLGVLGGIWDDLVRRAQRERFEQALRAVLPADLAGAALSDPACTWLWRSLREAETCGLDGGEVLRRVIGARSLTGARDVARVLDARVRRGLADARPQAPGPWAGRVPDTGSAEVNRYLGELAEAMDDRVRRLGEHVVQAQPLWARQGLGPLPDDAGERLDWEQRAGVIAAYRERYGHDHPAEPIGPEPGTTSPEARAAWHGALAALDRVGGIDLRHVSDGDLWLRRGDYERQTAWAPPHVAADLTLVRTAGRDAHVRAVRAEREAAAARARRTRARHTDLAALWRAVAATAADEERLLAEVQDTRRRWEQATDSARSLAVAADGELRRRRPGMRIAPLRPHPAESVTGPGRRTEEQRLADLRLLPESAGRGVPAELLQLRAEAAKARSAIGEMADRGEAAGDAPGYARRQREAVWRAPQSRIEPSAHARRAEPEREAG